MVYYIVSLNHITRITKCPLIYNISVLSLSKFGIVRFTRFDEDNYIRVILMDVIHRVFTLCHIIKYSQSDTALYYQLQ